MARTGVSHLRRRTTAFTSLSTSFRLISVYPGMGPKGPSVVIAIQSVGDRGEVSLQLSEVETRCKAGLLGFRR
jgi:hypothetical protein